jgi:diguanylate cyclase (GGDEF)-like protein
MIALLQNWIIRKIQTGRFSKRRDVFWFALTRSFWTSIAAVLLNFAVYQIMGRLGLLGVTVPPDPVADTIVTAFVAGPICLLSFYIVGSAIYDISMSRNEFERLSRVDPLTGLMNRRAFVNHIAGLHSRYVLVLFDIDRFKSINDNHGHGTGDEILIAVSDMFTETLGVNAVARLGGEEFAGVLTGVTSAEALDKINMLRQQLASRVFSFGDEEVRVTFSAGLSQSDGVTSYSTLLNHADKALYLAKASGRNRVVHSDELGTILPANEGFRTRRAI